MEEGLCQLASALWLARPGAEKSKLTEHTMWRIENHTDPTYGAGCMLGLGAWVLASVLGLGLGAWVRARVRGLGAC